MRINSLDYAKTVKVLAQLDAVACEAAGTFAERKIRECRGRLLVAVTDRWSRDIQRTRPNRPSVCVVEDDVRHAYQKWVKNGK